MKKHKKKTSKKQTNKQTNKQKNKTSDKFASIMCLSFPPHCLMFFKLNRKLKLEEKLLMIQGGMDGQTWTDRQTEKQIIRQAFRKTDRQTDMDI